VIWRIWMIGEKAGKRAGLGEWRGGEVVVRRKRAGSRNVNLLGERGKR
jgi:hypothetical protein